MALTTVDAVADMLRWGDPEKTKFEAQLPVYIEAASQVVEAEAGPFEARTIEHIADGASSIALPHRPNAVSKVEVAGTDGFVIEDGFVVPGESFSEVSGWVVNTAAGLVYGPFPTGLQNVRITYTVGYAPEDVPEAATLAATMVAVDKWAIASQRAPGLDDQVDPSYLIPRSVRELLAPFKSTQMPGFA
ncbi:hypothetical protein J2X03_003787 [Microbacterium trichothecenolyticum]|uniref:hypothetical protein n=1 Tax=Microbacterium trichothecenolyticum TaxID=69370 RepID=UPI002857B9D0|nr:hypothetical protein [Microbacterium trichothecenolyticum]MDR7113885.1 hypothetical protein [Microbacterium trichothecenolyticum]